MVTLTPFIGLLEFLLKRCLDAHYIHVNHDGDYCVQREGNTLYLLFEWSDGGADWRNNFDFPAKPYKDMGAKWYCHRGFLRVWKEIEPFVHPHIMDPTVERVYVVGYSHGAAIATLAHEYVWFNRPDLRKSLEGYGFGSPRCYWGFRVKKSLKPRWETFHPVRNLNDIVTFLPPALFGFVHVNKVLKLDGAEIVHKLSKWGCVNAHASPNYLHSLTKE